MLDIILYITLRRMNVRYIRPKERGVHKGTSTIASTLQPTEKYIGFLNRLVVWKTILAVLAGRSTAAAVALVAQEINTTARTECLSRVALQLALTRLAFFAISARVAAAAAVIGVAL